MTAVNVNDTVYVDGSAVHTGDWVSCWYAATAAYRDGSSVVIRDASGETVATDASIAEYLRWTSLERNGWVAS